MARARPGGGREQPSPSAVRRAPRARRRRRRRVAVLPLREDMLVLAPDGGVEVDVGGFETAAARAGETGARSTTSPRCAATHGELLPEDRYEDWAASAARGGARGVPCALLIELAALHDVPATWRRPSTRSSGRCSSTRCTSGAPRADAAVRRDGRRQQALAQYQQLRAALRRELAADPDPADRGALSRAADAASRSRRRAAPASRRTTGAAPTVATTCRGC